MLAKVGFLASTASASASQLIPNVVGVGYMKLALHAGKIFVLRFELQNR